MLSFVCFSYGPCQTPTLGFCVQRYLQITTFKPEKFWALHPYIVKSGYELKLEWDREKLFDLDVRFFLLSQVYCVCSPFYPLNSVSVSNFLCYSFQVTVMFQKLVSEYGVLTVTNISTKEECRSRPSGLNTVNLLKVNFLKDCQHCRASSILTFKQQVI